MNINNNNGRIQIGRQLAELRRERGLTVRQLSSASGINPSNLSRLENGKYNAGIDTVNRICEALQASIQINKK